MWKCHYVSQNNTVIRVNNSAVNKWRVKVPFACWGVNVRRSSCIMSHFVFSYICEKGKEKAWKLGHFSEAHCDWDLPWTGNLPRHFSAAFFGCCYLRMVTLKMAGPLLFHGVYCTYIYIGIIPTPIHPTHPLFCFVFAVVGQTYMKKWVCNDHWYTIQVAFWACQTFKWCDFCCLIPAVLDTVM